MRDGLPADGRKERKEGRVGGTHGTGAPSLKRSGMRVRQGVAVIEQSAVLDMYEYCTSTVRVRRVQ